MTMPPVPVRVGMNPLTADEVNVNVGTLLRQFVIIKENVGHYQAWLAGVDLKAEPYNMEADLEGLLKSAVFGLDSSLDAIDMSFINRLVGVW
jgi:hypothetical protein